MSKQQTMDVPAQNVTTEFLLYTTPNGNVKVEILLNNETLWLTQQRIADLFGVQRPAITKHLKNIFDSGELDEKSISSILEHVGENKQLYRTKYYNLNAIISVGYRVNSTQATQFRIWATQMIKDYIIKGFVCNRSGKHTLAMLRNPLILALSSSRPKMGLQPVFSENSVEVHVARLA